MNKSILNQLKQEIEETSTFPFWKRTEPQPTLLLNVKNYYVIEFSCSSYIILIDNFDNVVCMKRKLKRFKHPLHDHLIYFDGREIIEYYKLNNGKLKL